MKIFAFTNIHPHSHKEKKKLYIVKSKNTNNETVNELLHNPLSVSALNKLMPYTQAFVPVLIHVCYAQPLTDIHH